MEDCKVSTIMSDFISEVEYSDGCTVSYDYNESCAPTFVERVEYDTSYNDPSFIERVEYGPTTTLIEPTILQTHSDIDVHLGGMYPTITPAARVFVPQPTTYGTGRVVHNTTVVGGLCPSCRVGILETEDTCFCCGLLCSSGKRCPHCRAVFDD